MQMNPLYKHKKNNHLIHISYLLACLTAFFHIPLLHATDLIESYRRASQYDPQWSTLRANYFANKQAVNIGRAGLLPQINTSASYSSLDYDVDQNSDSLTVSGLSTLSVETAFECGLTNDIFLGDLTPDEVSGFSECAGTAQDGLDTSFTQTDIRLTMSQPLFRLDRWYNYKRSQTVTDQAGVDFQKGQQDLLIRVSETYFNALRAWDQVQYARSEENAIAQQLKLTQKRYQKGLISGTNVYEAQAAFDGTQASRMNAENLFEAAMEDLERMTRSPNLQISQLNEDLPLLAPQPNSAEAWVEVARKNNLDFISAKMSATAAKQNHKAKRSQHAPTLDLVAQVGQSDSDGQTATFDQGKTTVTSIGLNLNIPIFTGGGTRAQEKQAKYQMRAADYQTEHVLQEVVSTTRKLYRSIVTSVRRIEALKVAIGSNQQALKAVENGYRKGRRNVAEVIQAQRELIRSQTDYANARYDYIINTFKLKRVAGVLSEQDLSELNAWLNSSSEQARKPINQSSYVGERTEPYQPSYRADEKTFERQAYPDSNNTNHNPAPAYENSDNESSDDDDGPKSLIEAMKDWF